MPRESATTGVAPARDKTDSNVLSTISQDRSGEKGHDYWPVSLQYPVNERFGAEQGDEAVVTKEKVGEEL